MDFFVDVVIFVGGPEEEDTLLDCDWDSLLVAVLVEGFDSVEALVLGFGGAGGGGGGGFGGGFATVVAFLSLSPLEQQPPMFNLEFFRITLLPFP